MIFGNNYDFSHNQALQLYYLRFISPLIIFNIIILHSLYISPQNMHIFTRSYVIHEQNKDGGAQGSLILPDLDCIYFEKIALRPLIKGVKYYGILGFLLL